MNFQIDTVNRLKGEVKAQALDRLTVSVWSFAFFLLSPVKNTRFLRVVRQRLDTLWAKANEKTLYFKNSLTLGHIPSTFPEPLTGHRR